MEEILIDIYPF